MININGQLITRQSTPSYEIGGNYRDRMYQLYQDMYAEKYGLAQQSGQPVEQQTSNPQTTQVQ